MILPREEMVVSLADGRSRTLRELLDATVLGTTPLDQEWAEQLCWERARIMSEIPIVERRDMPPLDRLLELCSLRDSLLSIVAVQSLDLHARHAAMMASYRHRLDHAAVDRLANQCIVSGDPRLRAEALRWRQNRPSSEDGGGRRPGS